MMVSTSAPVRPKGSLGTSALLGLGLIVASASLHSVLDGIIWWLDLVVVVAIVLGSAAAIRIFVRARWVGSAVAVVVAVALITLLFAADTALIGMIPTPDTWQRFGDLTAAANASIQEQALPAQATQGILFLLCWVIAALAVLMDITAIWRRSPALAGIPLLVIVVVPSIVSPDLADPLFFLATAAVYLVMLRPPARKIHKSVAFGLGAAALVGALAAPIVLPSVPSMSGAAGGGGGAISTGINPMLDLGSDLRRSDPITALTYTTTSSNGQYLRLTTLEDFDGDEWEPVSIDARPDNDVASIGSAPGLGADVATSPTTTAVQIENSVGRWLPVPYPATEITGLTGDWYWEPDGLSIRTENSNMRSQEYNVRSLALQPTSDQLSAAQSSANLPLAAPPAGLDPVVGETALEVVSAAGAETDYDRAVALQDYFRGGDFAYSENAPVRQGFDGSSIDVLPEFLEQQTGYCVHFSSAMAVMARTLGIPSRVVVGFLPGEVDPNQENTDADAEGNVVTRFTVSSDNLHAWPELYFEGVGWTRFEPTPGRGINAVYPSAAIDNPNTPEIDESQPTPPSAAPTTPSTAAPTVPTDDPTTGSGATSDTATPVMVPIILSILGALLLLATPAIARAAIRARRTSAIRSSHEPASAAWAEIVDTARDLGYIGTAVGTPRDVERVLRQRMDFTSASDHIQRLRMSVEREVFADGSQVSVEVADVDAVRNVLTRNAGASDRLRAAVLPATIVDRVLTLRAKLSVPRT